MPAGYVRTGITAIVFTALTMALAAPATSAAAPTGSRFPRYDHVFLVVMENHNYRQIIVNPAAPEINALARDYGLATH